MKAVAHEVLWIPEQAPLFLSDTRPPLWSPTPGFFIGALIKQAHVRKHLLGKEKDKSFPQLLPCRHWSCQPLSLQQWLKEKWNYAAVIWGGKREFRRWQACCSIFMVSCGGRSGLRHNFVKLVLDDTLVHWWNTDGPDTSLCANILVPRGLDISQHVASNIDIIHEQRQKIILSDHCEQ